MSRKTNNLALSRVSAKEAGGAKRSQNIMGLLRPITHSNARTRKCRMVILRKVTY